MPRGRIPADLRLASSAAALLPIRCAGKWPAGAREYVRPMHPRHRRPRLLAALFAAAALCTGLPALAAQITDVRIGAHPKFTRVVFELDGRAGYSIERAGTDAAPELRITIEAQSSTRELRAVGD